MITYQLEKNKQVNFQYGSHDLPLLGNFCGLPHAVERVKKIILGLPGLAGFGFSIDVAHLSSAEIVRYLMIFVYLLVCGNI